MIPTLVWTLPRVRQDKYRGGFPLFFEQNLQQLLGYRDVLAHGLPAVFSREFPSERDRLRWRGVSNDED